VIKESLVSLHSGCLNQCRSGDTFQEEYASCSWVQQLSVITTKVSTKESSSHAKSCLHSPHGTESAGRTLIKIFHDEKLAA